MKLKWEQHPHGNWSLRTENGPAIGGISLWPDGRYRPWVNAETTDSVWVSVWIVVPAHVERDLESIKARVAVAATCYFLDTDSKGTA